MKKRHVFSFLSLMLAVLFAFSACTSPANTQNPGTTGQATAADTAAVSGSTAPAASEDGPLSPYPEPVVVNVMREANSDMWFPEGDDWESNLITRFYTEKLNIVYKVKWLLDKGQMETQLNLAIASDDIPDIFAVNQTQLYKLAKAGQIQTLNDAYGKYASQNLRDSLETNNKMFFEPSTVDGKLYGLPEPYDFCNTIPVLWIRTDWLNKLGLQPPKTLDDLNAVCKAFIEKDPDGNGKADTFGIALDNSLGLTFSGLAHAFGVYPNQLQPDSNGKLAYQDIQPQMKTYLKKLNEMYDAGIFASDFGVLDASKMAERVASEKVGIFFGAFWSIWWPAIGSKQNNVNAEWWAYPVPVGPDGTYKVYAENSCYTWLVVNKNFKYPEAAIKGNNLWYELWRGEYASFYHGHNATDYSQAGEGLHDYPPFWYDPPMKNLIISKRFYDPWDKGQQNIDLSDDPEAKKFWDKMWEWRNGNHSDPTFYGWGQTTVYLGSLRVINETYNPDNVVVSAYQGPITDVIAQKMPLAEKCRLEWMIKFIMGTEDVDAKFDAFAQEWLKVGGQDLTDEANRWYETNKK